jgi:predicted DCC family thiol-disulfide oxidoreductase YuxK
MNAPTTFYNADCPVCSAGVSHIRQLTGGSDDRWVDITAHPDALANHGVDLQAVKKRLHVIDRSGKLQVGVAAFAALWDETPRYRTFARIVRLPGVYQLATALYELLAIGLYAWNLRRERRRGAACSISPRPEDRP